MPISQKQKQIITAKIIDMLLPIYNLKSGD